MQTLIVTTENKSAAKLLLAFLKNVRLVKSVSLAGENTKAGIVSEPAEPYNWINPSRPATDEEIEQMLDECEAEEGIPSDIARKQTIKELKEWESKRRK